VVTLLGTGIGQSANISNSVGGHPFMMSTQRGRGSGSGGRMGMGVQPHVDVNTEN